MESVERMSVNWLYVAKKNALGAVYVHQCVKGGAITFCSDKILEYPVLMPEKCVACGACLKVCPVNMKTKFRHPLDCFAAYRNDSTAREDSASGGIASALMETALEQHFLGGGSF